MQPAIHRQELKQLVEIYAVRTRQLSEAVSVLGGHITAGRQIDETIIEVKKLTRLVEEAGLNLFALVEPTRKG